MASTRSPDDRRPISIDVAATAAGGVEVTNRARELPVRLILDGVQSNRILGPGESVTISLAPERTALGLLPEVAFLQRYRDAFTR